MKSMDSKSNPTLTLTPPSSNGRQHPPRRPNSRTPSISSSCSASSLSSSPNSSSPSPFHRLLPSSSIPFSWERHPGIPKSPSASPSPSSGDRHPLLLLLPPPPPLRSLSATSHRKRSDAFADPFAAALLECAKDAPPPADAIWWRRSDIGSGAHAGKMIGICRRTLVPDRLGFLDLFASLSCKTSCAVSDAKIVVPRSRLRAAAGEYGLLDRRAD